MTYINIEPHLITVPTHRMRALRPDVVDELANSISVIGILNPITVRRAEQGYVLIAGWHRIAAARKLNLKYIPADVREDLDANAILLAEIDENLVRAGLSSAERAMHLVERKRIYEQLHPAAKHGGDRKSVARDVTRAKKVVVLADIVGTALDQGAEIDALARLPEEEQRKLAARAKAGEKVTARHVAKKLKREARESELAAATEAASQALGEKVYGVIYADPPWPFGVWADSGKDRSADNHYPTMSTEAIKALPVPAGDDAVLFLWATPMMLPEAIEVMAAWGFKFKTCIVWEKDRDGLGYWVRNRVELLLIGSRGNVPAPPPGDQPPQIIKASRGRHSEKPTIVAEFIQRMFPNIAKLEMFARRARPGWDVWGNEVQHAEGHNDEHPTSSQGRRDVNPSCDKSGEDELAVERQIAAEGSCSNA
jgi:ParB/RepB/Spo0J family partition protein